MELLLGAQHLHPVHHLSHSTCWTEVGTEDQRCSVTAHHHTALMSGPNEILDQVPETLSSPASPHWEAFPGSCWKHPPRVHLAGLSRTLCPPHSLHQPCSGQPGSGMAPAACAASPLTVSRHLDGRTSLRSHPCPQRRGEVLCPLMSAGLLPGGTERGHSGKGARLPRPL